MPKTRSQAGRESPPPVQDIPTLFVLVNLDPYLTHEFEGWLFGRCPNADCFVLDSPEVNESKSPHDCGLYSSLNWNNKNIKRATEVWVHRLLGFLLVACWCQGVHPVVCIPASQNSRQWMLCRRIVLELRQHCLHEALDIFVLCGLQIKHSGWAETVRVFMGAGASATLNAADLWSKWSWSHVKGDGSNSNSSNSQPVLEEWHDEELKFYHRHRPWYLLTNFCMGIRNVSMEFTDRKTQERYPTTEHYFQAQKFTDDACRRKVATANSPRDAFQMANNRWFRDFKSYWDDQCRCGAIYKERVMTEGLLYKFSGKKPLARYSLLATGTCHLIEDSHLDSYWGVGPHGDGLNRLGYLLELVRFETLKDEMDRLQIRFESLFQLKDS